MLIRSRSSIIASIRRQHYGRHIEQTGELGVPTQTNTHTHKPSPSWSLVGLMSSGLPDLLLIASARASCQYAKRLQQQQQQPQSALIFGARFNELARRLLHNGAERDPPLVALTRAAAANCVRNWPLCLGGQANR